MAMHALESAPPLPAGAAGPLPPSDPDALQALMLALGAGSAQGAPPAGAPQSASEILQQILELADAYRKQEQSQQNLLLVEKLRTIAQQILANEERELDDLTQGKITPSAARRLA